MNKIFNWTIGSFFRSIGRILAYVVIGSLIGYLLTSTGFKFTDLFVMSVNAETLSSSQYNLYILEMPSENCTGGTSNGYKNLDSVSDTRGLARYQRLDYLTEVSTLTSGNTYTFSVIQSYNPKYFDSDETSRFSYSMEASTTTSTSGLSSSNVSNVSCNLINIENAYQMKLICSFTAKASIKLLFIRQNYNCAIEYIDYFNTYQMRVDLEDSTANAINNQTGIITNNQNQNTQSIINNNNTNTQNIINNNNENTQAIIDSNKVCTTTDIDKKNIFINHSRLSDSGVVQSGYTNYGVTDYIEYDTLELLNIWDSNITNTCFYNSDKQLITCRLNSSFSTGYINISNARYFRSTIFSTLNRPTFRVYVCKNGSQALDDTLNDDNVDESTSELGDFFEDFTTNTHGLTGVITAPLNAINSLTSSTCSPLVLPLPFINSNLTLPCMRTIYDDNFGGFMDLYDVITLGIVSYWVSIRIFNLVKDFKNPDHDEIEVMDL